MLKNLLVKMHNNARRSNDRKILKMLEVNSEATLLDVGCDDGVWTMELARQVGAKSIHGIEVVEPRIVEAQIKGIAVVNTSLNSPLPYADNFFDVVQANQVIEHLYDTDNFVSELCRILKPGGYAIISTENLSSWHNVVALALGFQPFSMSNFSSKGSIGNPFSLWRNESNEKSAFTSWQHVRLFSYFGLKDLFQKFNFKVEKIQTSGYYPLFGWLSNIDPIHGHYIAYKIRK